MQKGIMLNTDDAELMQKLQTLLSDVGPNGPVWEEELLPDGSVARKQIPALPRLGKKDGWLSDSYILTWGYVLERIVELMNQRRRVSGVSLLTLAQCWGDMPMDMWNRYLQLKKTYLLSMPETIEALQITHPMTPFYDFRMLDLKESTRARSQSTLERVCEPLGLSPMGIYKPFAGKMKVLSALRKMVLKTRRRAQTHRRQDEVSPVYSMGWDCIFHALHTL